MPSRFSLLLAFLAATTIAIIDSIPKATKTAADASTHLLTVLHQLSINSQAPQAKKNRYIRSNSNMVSHDMAEDDLITRLRLRVHASNLPRYGFMKTLPDTYAKITSVSPASGAPSGPEDSVTDTVDDRGTRTIEWGTTEVIRKSNNPQFTTTFPLRYEYGAECYFYVELYRKNGRRSDPTLLGSALCEVGDILGTRNRTKFKRLRKGGCVFCKLEPVHESMEHSVVRFQFSATQLHVRRQSFAMPNSNRFHGEPDTIIEIAKHHDRANKQSWTTVYRSQPIENSVNPTWDVAEINYAALCDGNPSESIRIIVKAHRKSAANVEIGFCETNLNILLQTQNDLGSDDPCYDLMKNGFIIQKSIDDIKEVGRLFINLIQVYDGSCHSLERSDDISSLSSDGDFTIPMESERSHVLDVSAIPMPIAAPATFQEYMEGGCELRFCLAIDFTSSNGDPRIPGTLHHQDPNQFNDYEETISSIGASIEHYSDECTVLGFGAKFNGVTQHVFQCGSQSSVQSVEGLMDAYKSMFQADLIMSGPTVFDPVLQFAAARAKKFQSEVHNKNRYTVLLIITDGIADNLEETRRKLAVYSTVPLSVIFVGVGRSDFTALTSLCWPTSPGQRQNTTFCEFRKHQHNPISLGRAALKGLPAQLVEYMDSNSIRPSSNL